MSHEKQKMINMLLSIIIVLLVVIAVGAFFLGKTLSNPNVPLTGNTQTSSDITVQVISDIRCGDCQEDGIISQLKLLPVLANVEFTKNDFSDAGMKEFLQENNITALPAIIFNRGYVDAGLNDYLTQLPSGSFSLNVGAQFDPFIERNERGYRVLSEENLATLKAETKYVKGNAESPYMWLEYTNFACPACVSFHKSGIHKKVLDKYNDSIQYITKHFHFFPNAYPAAELIECAADQLGSEGFYALEKNIFQDEILDIETLTQKAVTLGADEATLNACLESDKHIATYEGVKLNGEKIFQVSATPTNILLNTETGEFMKATNVMADIEKFMQK